MKGDGVTIHDGPLEGGHIKLPGLRDADISGHTHEGSGGELIPRNSVDYIGPVRDLRPGGQELIRTPSGAIRSTIKPSTPAPMIRETLRGPAVPEFPSRE